MKNSFVSLGGLSPIQKISAKVYLELCSNKVDFCIYSSIGSREVVDVYCFELHRPFFTWLNRMNVFYSVFGFSGRLCHLILC